MPRRRFKEVRTAYKRRPGPYERVEINCPSAVREFFDAQAGDQLVFVEGNAHSAERAAVLGPYLIVRLEQAPAEEPEPAVRVVKPVPAETAAKWKGTVLDVRVVKPEREDADDTVADLAAAPPPDAGGSFFESVLKQCGRAGDPQDGKQRR